MTKKTTSNSVDDWLDFSLKILVKNGPDALKINPLCEAKGVSKGSFYHHFKNRSAFVEQLMEYWFHKMTLDFIAQANTESSPIERLEKLDTIIANNNIEAELHIRAWSLKEPKIATYLAEIDCYRLNYLATCYIELGMNKKQAKDVATMAYSSFLGLQQIHPKPSVETILRIASLGPRALIEELMNSNEVR